MKTFQMTYQSMALAHFHGSLGQIVHYRRPIHLYRTIEKSRLPSWQPEESGIQCNWTKLIPCWLGKQFVAKTFDKRRYIKVLGPRNVLKARKTVSKFKGHQKLYHSYLKLWCGRLCSINWLECIVISNSSLKCN